MARLEIRSVYVQTDCTLRANDPTGGVDSALKSAPTRTYQ